MMRTIRSRVTIGVALLVLAALAGAQTDLLPDGLALGPEPGPRLALALHLASEGRFAEAAERLRALREDAGVDAELGARVARELGRIEAVNGFREAFLREMLADRKEIRIEHGGRAYQGRIAGMDAGVLRMRGAGRTVDELPVAAYDPDELLVDARRRKKLTGRHAWIGAYLKLLAGRTGIELYLKEADAATADLRRDVDSFAALLRDGEAAGHLTALSESAPTADAAGAEALLLRVAALRETYGALPFVAARADALTRCAATLHALRFDPTSADCLGLSGDVVPIGDGRVRIAYDFRDPKQAEDFVQTEYLEALRLIHDVTNETARARSAFAVESGAWRGAGETVYRHRLAFTGRMTIRYELTFASLGDEQRICDVIMIGLCDDERRSYIGCRNFGDLEAIDRPSGHKACAPREDRFLRTESPYQIEIEHDGEREVVCRVNGEVVSRVPCGARRAGAVFVWLQSDRSIALENFVIEGTVDLRTLPEQRAAWVAAQVRAGGR